jgi:hypothetical protein
MRFARNLCGTLGKEPSIERSPGFPARRLLGVQFGILQILLEHIFGQAQIPVLVILELVADVDQVMSRICVDIVGFLFRCTLLIL